MSAKKLIINADDYGLTPGVSAGIRHAHLNGVLTSTTAIMTSSYAEKELSEAISNCPELGLGVHLNITSGPLTLPPDKTPSVSAILDFGDRGRHKKKLIGKADLGEVELEWRSQIDRFVSATGRMPDHIDSHHHSSYHTTGLCGLMLDLARECGCPVRMPLNDPAVSEEVSRFLLGRSDITKSDMFFGDFFGAKATRARILEIINSVSEGVSELMTHPGYCDEALKATSIYGMQRESELEILTDPLVFESVASSGVQLVNFGTLRRN